MSKYSEIAEILKGEILGGLYSSTGRLPTEYELVKRFGVSRQTVRQSIALLKNYGVVYQVQGSGTYVASADSLSTTKTRSAFKNICILSTYISEYIFPSIVRGITTTLAGRHNSQNSHHSHSSHNEKHQLERHCLL